MHAKLTIAASVLILASLSGCDDKPAAPTQAAQATLPPPPCNCTVPAAAPAPQEPMTRLSEMPHRYRHHYRYRGHAWAARGESPYYSQSEVDSYDYVSASRVSYSESESSYGGYAEGGDDGRAIYDGHRRFYRGRITWVDGYGRGYFDDHPLVAASMTGKRLAPYHGYDVDCPDPR